MSEAYVGEIRMFAGNFPPRGWALCQGQIMSIQQNTALFSLLGTTYGGDGKSTFALPNLVGRAPMHFGQGPGLSQHNLGGAGGSSNVTLLVNQIPAHTHVPAGAPAPNADTPAGGSWASTPVRGGTKVYGGTPDTTMSPQALNVTGGSQPHNNMQPYLGVNFIICLQGVFPPRP